MFEDYIVILPSSLGSIVTSHSIKLPRFFSVSLLTKFTVLVGQGDPRIRVEGDPIPTFCLHTLRIKC